MKIFLLKLYFFIFLAIILLVLSLPSEISEEKFIIETPVEKIKINDITETSVVSGNSMSTFGYPDGKTFTLYKSKDCNVGDICVFTCTSDKCELAGISRFIKVLKFINNGCYFFEGRRGPWIEDGLSRSSWDSNIYGCLTSDEFYFNGFVE